jgi:hypothetical protein
MKILTFALASLLSVGVFAAKDKNWDRMSVSEAKQHRLEKLDRKSAMIEEARTCVNAATTKDQIKNCKQEMKEEKRAMKDEKKAKKQAQEDDTDIFSDLEE